MKTELYKVNSILKQSALLTAILALTIALVAFLAGQAQFSLSLLVNAAFGLVALLLLVNDIRNAFQTQALRAMQFKFIFRLACFAILIYFVLVRLHMNPFGVALGLTLPVFAMMAVIFRLVRKEANADK
ncbi:MAG: ATP synthase subunit I [Deferribacteraceae bacterium]|jgi:Ca2+/Na+ antiporter|nr:ATP synthase subunit I [Deferribacteraceae bacterium]